MDVMSLSESWVSASVPPRLWKSSVTKVCSFARSTVGSVSSPGIPRPVMSALTMFSLLNGIAASSDTSASMIVPSSIMDDITEPSGSASPIPVRADPSPSKAVALTVPITSTVAPGLEVPTPRLPMVTMSRLPKSGAIFVPAMAAAELISSSVTLPSSRSSPVRLSSVISSPVTVSSSMAIPVTAPSARSSPVTVPSSMVPETPPDTVSSSARSPRPRFARAVTASEAPVPP